MSYKVYIYSIVLLITAFAFSGINFNNFFRKDHIIEARIFTMLCILGLSYLVSSFIINFINLG